MILEHCNRASCVQIIEALRKQVAEQTTLIGDQIQQLAAAQSRIVELRTALEEIVRCPTWAVGTLVAGNYKTLLATKDDSSAFDRRLQEERERIATYFVTEANGAVISGSSAAAMIRGMK